MKKLIFLILTLFSCQSLAERLFDVEVIVFKRNINIENTKEKWSDKPIKLPLQGAVSVFDGNALRRNDIQLLPRSQWQLTEEFRTLSGHAGYRPLLHAAWRQDDRGRSQLPKIRFTAGSNFEQEFNLDGTVKSYEEDEYAQIQPYGGKNQPIYQLDGYIRLYVQHYLFIETNLIFREPTERIVLDTSQSLSELNQQNPVIAHFDGLHQAQPNYHTEKFLKSFPFKQKRRMRSGEIHYLDHPLLGLIIQVTRV